MVTPLNRQFRPCGAFASAAGREIRQDFLGCKRPVIDCHLINQSIKLDEPGVAKSGFRARVANQNRCRTRWQRSIERSHVLFDTVYKNSSCGSIEGRCDMSELSG